MDETWIRRQRFWRHNTVVWHLNLKKCKHKSISSYSQGDWSGDWVQISEVLWSVVIWSELTWFMWSDFVLKWNEVSYGAVLGDRSTMYCTLGWPYTEGTWLYCDYFVWCVSSAVVVLTGFVMVSLVHVGVFWHLCGCLGNMCARIYCVFCCLFCVLCCLYCVLCCFVYIYVLSVLVLGLLPPSDNWIAVGNNKNNITKSEMT